MSIDEIYEVIDEISDMKRGPKPSPGYFPSLSEINTYARSDVPYIIPYLLWLDSNLESEDVKKNIKAVNALRKIVEEREERGDV